MERPFSVWSNADHTGIWWKQSGLGLAESRLDMFFPGKVMKFLKELGKSETGNFLLGNSGINFLREDLSLSSDSQIGLAAAHHEAFQVETSRRIWKYLPPSQITFLKKTCKAGEFTDP